MTRPTTTGKAQDLITFTRSTTGTYLGSDGLLKSAAIDEARIEYDASGNCLGLLVEEARTNKVAYSQDFTQVWYPVDLTIASAPVAAPDGTMTATHVVKTGSNAHLVALNIVSTADRHSIWARTVSGTGTMHIGGSTSGTLVTVTEEWQRLDVQCDNSHVYAANLRGDATLTEVYIWGSQAETATFPTSYIPTSGSAVTRAADVASLAVSEFGYNQDQGTVVAQATSFYLGQNRETVISTADSSSNLGVYVGKTAGGGDIDALYAGEGGSNTYFSLGVITEDTSYKFAFAIKTDDFAGSKDGGAVVTDTSGTQRTNITDLGIGSRKNAGNRLNGHIKSIQYYPLRLSNAQLQALTV